MSEPLLYSLHSLKDRIYPSPHIFFKILGELFENIKMEMFIGGEDDFTLSSPMQLRLNNNLDFEAKI